MPPDRETTTDPGRPAGPGPDAASWTDADATPIRPDPPMESTASFDLSGTGPDWPRGRRGRRRRGPAPGGGGPWAAPSEVGNFLLLEEVGRGGCGVVYRARDKVVGRTVAVKLTRADARLDPEMARRLLREARAAGGLAHPNIVPVHAADWSGGRFYIVSAFCEGPDLGDWIRGRDGLVPWRDAARIAADLADAVQHVHDNGICHRDLKPSNVLLWPEPAAGEGGFVPKLTDFGLARIAEEAGDATRTGVAIGSPPYMAPEQAAGRPGEVGPATDVYGLGAILYELLTGRPPFRGTTPEETIAQVLDAPLVRPGVLRVDLPRDLETVTMACLAREPSGRYTSAARLAEDLRRVLDGRPIRARRPSPAALARDWAGRRPRAATALAAVAVGLIVLLALGLTRGSELRRHNAVLIAAIEEGRRQAAEADAQRRLADRHRFAWDIRAAQQALDLGQPQRAQAILAESAARGAPRDFARDLLRRIAAREVEQLGEHDDAIKAILPTPEGGLVTIDFAGTLLTWDLDARAASGRATLPGPTRNRLLAPLAGGLLAVADEPAGPDGNDQALALHDAATGRRLAVAEPTQAGFAVWLRPLDGGRLVLASRVGPTARPRVSIAGVAPGPTLRTIATFGPFDSVGATTGGGEFFTLDGGRLRRYDARTGRVLGEALVVLDGTPESSLVPGPDGRLVVIHVPGRGLRVVEAATGAVVASVDGQDVRPEVVSFSRDGRALVIAEFLTGRVHLWVEGDPAPRQVADGVPAARRGTAAVGFSPDGRRLALGVWEEPGRPAAPRVLDVATGRELARFPGRPERSGPLAFTPDGRGVLVSAGPSLALWHLEPAPGPPGTLAGHDDEAWALAWSPDGSTLASGSDDDAPETLKLWNPADGRQRRAWKAHESTVSALAYSPDGSTLASASLGRSVNVRLWGPDGRMLADLEGHTGRVRAIAFRPDGGLLATAGDDGTIRIWDPRDGRPLGLLGPVPGIVRALAFSPDGATLASASSDRSVRLWDPDAGRVVRELPTRLEPLSAAWSPDGATLAVGDNRGSILLFRAGAWSEPEAIHAEEGEIRALAFHPDGTTLASAGTARTVRLWDASTRQGLLALDGHAAQVNALAFRPDGHVLASCDHLGAIRLWHAGPAPAR